MIVVSGIQRTGTSLMMSILKNNGFDVISTNQDFEKNSFFKKLQPEYHEHKIFSGYGFNKNNINGFEKILNKKLCCKLMADGLKNSDKFGLKYFDKLIVTVRTWREQTASWKPVTRVNIENMVKTEKKMEELIISKGSIDEFIEDRTYSPGILYAIEYIKILNFIFDNKLQKKTVFINFDDLLNNFNFVSRNLRKDLNMKLKNNNVIDKEISKYSGGEYEFSEFKEGFFSFLDTLETKLKFGNLDTSFLIECERWKKIINECIIKKEEFTKNKYGFSIITN